jgi:hypothetical protein
MFLFFDFFVGLISLVIIIFVQYFSDIVTKSELVLLWLIIALLLFFFVQNLSDIVANSKLLLFLGLFLFFFQHFWLFHFLDIIMNNIFRQMNLIWARVNSHILFHF